MTSVPPDVGLPGASRGWRLGVLAAVAALLTYGTIVGQDDLWPFGPLRMYATSSGATGAVSVVAIQVKQDTGGTNATDDWQDAPLTPSQVGLNRAEVEGQIGRIESDPRLLGELAAAHDRLRPDDPAWAGLRLVRRSAQIVDRRPTGVTTDLVLLTWTAP